MTTARLALFSFLLSLGGLVASAALFTLIYFQCLPNTSYVWVAVTILLTQLPALALSIPCRTLPLGRAALVLSSSVLVGVIAGFLLFAPLSSGSSGGDPTRSFQEEVGQQHRMDDPTHASNTITLRTDRFSSPFCRAQEGANSHA